MAPQNVTSVASTTSVLYLNPGLKLTELGGRGMGYVASRQLRRGELLLEERPFVWDSGSSEARPDLSGGVDWLIETGVYKELPCNTQMFTTPRERAECVATLCAFRNQTPCADGHYPAMLFRASSRFNHACYPNAGAYMPGGDQFSTVADYKPVPLATFALEEIQKGHEVCICYLSDANQLSPAEARRSSLEGWGFTCQCHRCKGGRPLDKRLQGVDMDALLQAGEDRDTARLIRDANHDYRALFDPTSEEYNPPKDDFMATIERLNDFRERHKLLDKAHLIMQRIRKELIAAFLLDGPDGEIGRKFADASAALLIEEMYIQNAMLPMLSPCKVPTYVLFLRVLKNTTPSERVWLQREVKADGVDLWHRNSLWTFDPQEAKRLGAAEPRNLPERPAPGPPPRSGPAPSLEACCLPGLAARPPPWAAPARRREYGTRAATVGWPRGGRSMQRRRTSEASQDPADSDLSGMPPLVCDWSDPSAGAPTEDPAELEEPTQKLLDLWEAYGEYGKPSAAARGLRGAGAPTSKGKENSGSWFKFAK